jgi:hypothetical protein
MDEISRSLLEAAVGAAKKTVGYLRVQLREEEARGD